MVKTQRNLALLQWPEGSWEPTKPWSRETIKDGQTEQKLSDCPDAQPLSSVLEVQRLVCEHWLLLKMMCASEVRFWQRNTGSLSKILTPCLHTLSTFSSFPCELWIKGIHHGRTRQSKEQDLWPSAWFQATHTWPEQSRHFHRVNPLRPWGFLLPIP